MPKVLVVTTSRKTHGGISSVLNLYRRSQMWQKYHCKWIATHRSGNAVTKLFYLVTGFCEYLVLLPFYDIVHIHFSLAGSAKRKMPFFKLAKALGKKTVIHLHCGSQIDEIWNNDYQTMFEQCDVGIVLSENLKQKVEEHIGKSNKIKVVYNPCPLIDKLETAEKQNMVLFSGLLAETKGYKDLLKAFAKVADRHPDWKLVVAGSGDDEQARDLVKAFGIEKRVVLPGWVDEERMQQYLSEAKVYCLPSYAEGFPMSVLEAWAFGLPVISTPVGGIPDVAVDGENMLLFNPGDVETLAKKLEMVISDEGLREKLAAASSKLAAEKFSLKSVTEEVGEIYDHLLCSSR